MKLCQVNCNASLVEASESFAYRQELKHDWTELKKAKLLLQRVGQKLLDDWIKVVWKA